MKSLKLLALVAAVVGLGLTTQSATMQAPSEAPAGFDNLTNGHIPLQADFEAAEVVFAELEEIDEGLGPVFNMRGCGECHGNPVTGAGSQITELRAGHFNGSAFVPHRGDSLIHSQAINADIQEQIEDGNEVRSFRTSISIMGDGFVEAILASSFTDVRNEQLRVQPGAVGTIINVPVLEDNRPGVPHTRFGRFGHKNQQASLLDFAGDAYLNEMGITNCVPGEPNFGTTNCANGHENTSNGDSVADFDEVADPEDAGDDVQTFADFMRSLKAPPRGPITTQVTTGLARFRAAGCAVCHTETFQTASPGTIINGRLAVSAALGNKLIHPFGDYMLHDINTGDGIVQNGPPGTRNMVRTAPLWGVRMRNRLMHDGLALTFNEAILRHGGTQGAPAANAYRALAAAQKADLIAFLRSL